MSEVTTQRVRKEKLKIQYKLKTKQNKIKPKSNH